MRAVRIRVCRKASEEGSAGSRKVVFCLPTLWNFWSLLRWMVAVEIWLNCGLGGWNSSSHAQVLKFGVILFDDRTENWKRTKFIIHELNFWRVAHINGKEQVQIDFERGPIR